MEKNKKDLAKKAFAALMLASSLTVVGHAEGVNVEQETLLAAGCGGGSGSRAGCGAAGGSRAGCGSATSSSTPSSGTYGTGASTSGTTNPRSNGNYGGSSNYDTTSGTYGGSSSGYNNPGSVSGYGSTNRPANPYGNGNTEDFNGSTGNEAYPAQRGTGNPSNWNR